MFYIGVLSGILALVYPQEPLAKSDQIGEFWDIVRFYYHHWMLMAIPLLMVLLKHHTLSWKRVLWAPTGGLLLMLFIILNQWFQSELGFIPLRGAGFGEHTLKTDYWEAFYDVNWKNSSYIYGPGTDDAVGNFLAMFCPKFFSRVPVGPFKGQEKYWPWFWMIVPVYVLVTPLAFGLCMIFDHKNFANDMKTYYGKVKAFIVSKKKGSNAPKTEEEAKVEEEVND